ncbi:MAG: 3-deoxy-manno-octulosonate cytidylyltransferase [Legionellaceae bacterium]|nr:3-deoxy-manno-octulosonate cytidylyltransferase [Legionellaceae bacterium]
MTQPFHVIIPARYHSSRLPGKLLMDIHGQTVLQRVWKQAMRAHPATVTIATDSEEIAHHVAGFPAHCVMTSSKHQSGTDRIAELVNKSDFADNDIIVNVQGDEPFIAPELIVQVAEVLALSTASLASLYAAIESREQFHNPNIVKLVFNQRQQALYFSRSAIPAHRDDVDSIANAWRHIGLYAYRVSFLRQWPQLPPSMLEQHECLEQLRMLDAGYTMQLAEANVLPAQDINTLDDLSVARQYMVVE